METTISANLRRPWVFCIIKRTVGDRLVVGHQTLDLITQVRILVPQPTLFLS